MDFIQIAAKVAPRWAKNIGKKILYAHWARQRAKVRRKMVRRYTDAFQKKVNDWVRQDKETSNFYYDLTDLNKQQLAHFVSAVTGTTFEKARALIEELTQDTELLSHLQAGITAAYQYKDIEVAYGRRLGWYAIARITKPKILVETGVDLGVGACVLAKALIRNAAEGSPGRYYGFDLNPAAGRLLTGPYAEVGEMVFGDSIESLGRFPHQIDLFINDSDHSEQFEESEYVAMTPRLSAKAIVLSDNSHSTDALGRFARSRGYNYLFFREQPLRHWYPGAGIGAAFQTQTGSGG